MEMDITSKGDLFGWFVERLLDARGLKERHDVLFQDDGEEIVYLAGLLEHMTSAPWLARLDAVGERLDMDVASRTGKEKGLRDRQAVYQATAERYLLHLSLWDGLQGNQRDRYYRIDEDNLANRASGYYGLAAELSARLPPPVCTRQPLLRHMADHLGMWLSLLSTLRGDILGLLPTLSPGQDFHLARGSAI